MKGSLSYDTMLADHAKLAAQARTLRDLHENFLVMPNAWDAESARLFAAMGFPAVATTSSGVAANLGFADGEKTPVDEVFSAIRMMSAGIDVPLSADLEAGYQLGAAELVDRLLESGACGLNLEDSDHHSRAKLLGAEINAQRLAAVKDAARSRGVDVFLNARVDVYARRFGPERRRLDEALRRAELYLMAGADCVYPILVSDDDTIQAFVRRTNGPVNILHSSVSPSLGRLRELGVRRVTFGGALQRLGAGGASSFLRQLTAP